MTEYQNFVNTIVGDVANALGIPENCVKDVICVDCKKEVKAVYCKWMINARTGQHTGPHCGCVDPTIHKSEVKQ